MPRHVRFAQVDVFTDVPWLGNPLAVIFDADALTDDAMRTIARWTNLSETSFVCAPTDPAADYRVRIFTPGGELPFAGHPTLGTAHAVREAGLNPRLPGQLIQQCGAGFITLREFDGGRAFAAPPARITPLAAHAHAALTAALRTDAIDFGAPPCGVDNGAPWLVVRLKTAADCLALAPDAAALADIAASVGADGLAVYAPHPAGGPATFEVRCLMMASGDGAGLVEDPVTGSANAAIAGLLGQDAGGRASPYTVRQGTAIGRAGQVSVDYDETGKIWIGGATVTVVQGTFLLP
ncbi:MAG: putative isomerase YddE [Burkholderia plantarii]|nr:MAG: putative isomerase YddE [Burkholderia plantarii]